MLEILQFIFQDFEHWFGTLVILYVVFSGIGKMFNLQINKVDKQDKK